MKRKLEISLSTWKMNFWWDAQSWKMSSTKSSKSKKFRIIQQFLST